jgi:predicted amino acid dehydrogenase
MAKVLVIHLGDGRETINETILGSPVEITRIGTRGDPDLTCATIAEYDGQVDAIGLEGMPHQLRLGAARADHELGQRLMGAARRTPVVNGSGVRSGLERWGVILADRAQPGIFSQKQILLCPGLNHEGLEHALSRYSQKLRYADPVIYFALPEFPGVGHRATLKRVAAPTLEQLKDAPFRRIMPQIGSPKAVRKSDSFRWADVIAGDIGAILRYSPPDLHCKTVVVNSASEEEIDELRRRGVSIVVATIPLLGKHRHGWGDGTAEALLAALRPDPQAPLSEDTYLDMIANLDWKPDIRYLQQEEAAVNRFAFVIHPLRVDSIYKHRIFRWTKILPDALLEEAAAYLPPLYLSKITGGQSPVTGQKIEGHLISLGATPRIMVKKNERFMYKRLNQAARLAEQKGARIMGLGAFTSVVGDAGITVAHEADIAITSGNSLTVAATLEAAKQAVIKMGLNDLTRGRAMVIGATGSIGSVCSRLLAQAIKDVVLVSIEPEKLIDLKRTIKAETPGANVVISTKVEDLACDCDLIVTATSAFGQRVLDITRCKPGAIICDVARPPDVNPAEAALRPDVLVVESGEVLIPGDIDFGYDIGLPPKTSYACLAETALLAMEGRFEDYTLGRNINMEKVKEIYRLFKKHNFQLAGLRSFGKYISDEDLAHKRALAEELKANPEKFASLKKETAEKLAIIPPMSKGIQNHKLDAKSLVWLLAGSSFLVYIMGKWFGNHNGKDRC